IHRLDAPFTQFPGYHAVAKTIAAHPITTDIALLGRTIPNTWKSEPLSSLPSGEARGQGTVKSISPSAGAVAKPASRSVEISAEKNLTYSTRPVRAKPGDRLYLTFKNPASVSHNWVLLKPGALARVGALANKLVADPEAVLHQYVPRTDDVLVYTDITPPHQQFTITFEAPHQPGRYPYLCTFPGHWMIMNGDLIVE